MAGLQVTITNYSDTAWSRYLWQVGAGQENTPGPYDEISQVPAETLEANVGLTIAAANSEQMTFIVEDDLWMIVGYQSSAGTFAVKLYQWFHMFGIGAQDSWSWLDNATQKWNDPTHDASPQTWIVGKYQVLATPTLTSSSASVSIVVRNAE